MKIQQNTPICKSGSLEMEFDSICEIVLISKLSDFFLTQLFTFSEKNVKKCDNELERTDLSKVRLSVAKLVTNNDNPPLLLRYNKIKGC